MGVVSILPVFHSRIYSLRYGRDAIEVFHDRSECQRGQKILEDHNDQSGPGGRRRCAECSRFGPI